MQKNSKRPIQILLARPRPRTRPPAGAGAYRKLLIKVILILPAKTTVRVNINASVQYIQWPILIGIYLGTCEIFAAAKANAHT